MSTAATPLQELLFLWLANSDLGSRVVGWAHHRAENAGGFDDLGPIGEAPYELGIDALADGWRLIQASPVPTVPSGDELKMGPLHHEFVFERMYTPASTGSAESIESPEVQLSLVAIIVDDYDDAIAFYSGVLGFEVVEDSPSLTNDGRPKRWVELGPPGGHPGAGLLLAKADGEAQQAAVGHQFAGRVGFFLRVADFGATLDRVRESGVAVRGEPRDEPYGRVVVFEDPYGNAWDLLGPRP